MPIGITGTFEQACGTLGFDSIAIAIGIDSLWQINR
jgi:hypothetical protein